MNRQTRHLNGCWIATLDLVPVGLGAENHNVAAMRRQLEEQRKLAQQQQILLRGHINDCVIN